MRGFYRDQQGTEYNKYFFVAHAIAGGYTSLITGKPNQISQQALTDCQLLEANYQRFTALYDTRPDLERVGRRFAERYFVEKERKEIEIVLLDAESWYQLFQQHYPGLEQQIAQYHIAFYFGHYPYPAQPYPKELVTIFIFYLCKRRIVPVWETLLD